MHLWQAVLPCMRRCGRGADFLHISIGHISKGLNQLLFPSKCLKCGRYTDTDPGSSLLLSDYFCTECAKAGISMIHSPKCTLCGLPLPESSDARVCEACLKNPLRLRKVRGAAEYKGLVKDAVHLFKYQSRLSLAKVFEKMIQDVYNQHFASSDHDLLLPVPLHKKRLRKRGFNQAYILVRNLEKKRICIHALVRKKKTASQTGFDMVQRKQNLKNAFEVKDKKAVENKSILLVDDVLTTGATCNEAAKELLKHGASRVDAMVLARA